MVRPGYKQTEVGVIPEDWACTSVRQLVCDGALEKPLDGNHGSIHPKKSDFVRHGIPFVMAKDVGEGRVDLRSCAFISKEQADSLQKGFSQPGDVLLTHKATIGNTAVVGDIVFDYIMLTPQVTYYRVANQALLSNLYLRYYFDSSRFQAVLQTMSRGGTRAYIGITAQLQLPVVLPPNEGEQEAIAEALSDADALIELLEKLVAKKRQIKQGAMQELLTGKTRLPGFSGQWEEKRLGDVVDADPEALSSNTDPDYEFKYIALEDVDKGSLTGYTEHVFRNAPSRARRKLRPLDVLVSTVRPNLMSHLLFFVEGGDWVCSTGFCVVRCRRHASHPGFVFYQMFGDQVNRQITTLLAGSNYPAINSSDVRALEIPLPSYEEQEAIALILSDMDAEIAALETKLAKARQIKQGMMQELLTGRIRLV